MYATDIIDKIIEKGVSCLVHSREPRNLYDPVDYMMSIGGKRIRPRLCLTAYNLFSDNIGNDVIYPSLALEIFHTFTLIHDDIMDRSDTRRGCQTVYRKWNENVAILSGDVMEILAYKYLSAAQGAFIPQAMDLFTTTAIQVCEGQQLDMDFENAPFITMDDYLQMVGLKTAVLIACAAKIGAILAGQPEPVCKALYDYGYQLGVAFQITDDYLDTFGNEKIFGKKIGGDIANNKKTWLLVSCMKSVSGENKKELERILAMGDEMRDEKVAAMQRLYVKSGVKTEAEEAIKSYYQKAMDSLAPANLNEDQTARMKLFAEELLHREK